MPRIPAGPERLVKSPRATRFNFAISSSSIPPRPAPLISGVTTSFVVYKVLFVGWEVSFDNRLSCLESSPYRVDAAYIGPDGRTL